MTLARIAVPREFMHRSVAATAFDTFRIWLGIFAAFWICGRFVSAPVWVASAFMIGVLQYHLNVLGHDGLHFLLSPKKRQNDLICRWFLHGPQGAPLGVMRANHLFHHTAVGSAADTDAQYYGLQGIRSPRAFAWWLFSACFGGMTYPIVKKLVRLLVLKNHDPLASAEAKLSDTPKRDRRSLVEDLLSVVVSQAVIAFTLYWITGKPWAYLALWVAPLFTIMMGLNAIRSCLEHVNLPHESASSREYTFISHPFERFFLSPYNMNFHTEHHRYMSVPYRHLPALRKHLREHRALDETRIYPTYWAKFRHIYRGFGKRASSHE